MLSPRNAQIIALVVASSFLIAVAPARSIHGQTKTADQASIQGEAAKQKPDYSQEAVVIEQLAMAYRFERDGTGRRELSLRVKVQSDAGVERFGQLIFPYTSGNENLEMDFVRVRKADGTVVSATASDVQDLSAPLAREAPIYTDLRQKTHHCSRSASRRHARISNRMEHSQRARSEPFLGRTRFRHARSYCSRRHVDRKHSRRQ